MKKKIGLVSLGCPKNLVDGEIMLGQLTGTGYEITNDKELAQILIVNTCGFIDSAKKESIDTILEMAECKKRNCEILVVTGCMAERYRDEILKEIPEVDAVLGTGSYHEIAKVIEKAEKGEKSLVCGELIDTAYLENQRIVSTGKGFAYLKIAEGCDNCCTYCIIPKLKGRYRSRKMDNILSEASWLASQGVRELVLIAQDTTRYGVDLYNQRKLHVLIQEISKISGIEWIRLLYCYPEEITEDLIQEFKENDKLCKYMDIPVQHASDPILKAMGRRGEGREIKALLNRLKQEIPGMTLRTSLIVGFPGESEEDFNTLYDFVKEMAFDRMGVFTYSREDGTAAAKMKPQVTQKVKKARYHKLMELQREISANKNQSRLNKIYRTIVEGVAEDGIFYYGRTYAEAPEIDGVVYFTSMEPLTIGDFVNVKILSVQDYDLIGEVIHESAQ